MNTTTEHYGEFSKEKQAQHKPPDKDGKGTKAPPAEWPAPIWYGHFKQEIIEKPKPIIENLLDTGSRMIVGGGSKTYKTWAMGDMAISIASAAQWWGFNTFLAPCLYVNFELKNYYMQRRFRAIARAKGLEGVPDKTLAIWNLRGYEIQLALFIATLIKFIREHGILVVFIDPFYKLLGDRDERISADLNQLLAAFDEINRVTGATVVFATHFTKGNQSGKEHIDRISGGGSIGRDPDSLITLTNHEEQHAFSVEFTVRDFAPIAPFVVRWEHPLLERTELDPERLKRQPSNQRTSKTKRGTRIEEFAKLIPVLDPISQAKLWEECEKLEINVRTARRYIDILIEDEKIFAWSIKREKVKGAIGYAKRPQS